MNQETASLTALIEEERCRIAALLEQQIVEPLNLLLAQASAYEQAFGAQPQTRLALSVLVSLARQAIQQARDLESALHPTTLETLGLESALETLAAQSLRAHGLVVALVIQRLPERLPLPLELALYRAAQDGVQRAQSVGRASRVEIRLTQDSDGLRLEVADNGSAPDAGEVLLQAMRRRAESLGGLWQTGAAASGGLCIVLRFRIVPAAQLTEREIETLRLLAEGLSNKQIGAAMGVSLRTVKFHLDNLYGKLGVNSRTEALLYAMRQGWVQG